MKCLVVLFVCWCSSILPMTSCIRADGFSCTSAYWSTITCVLNITGTPAGQSNTTYRLKFFHKYKKTTIYCPLMVINHSYSCVCKMTNDSFSSSDRYVADLCHESGCHPVKDLFEPSQNIQFTPPHEVEVRQTPESFNITWKSGYEDHPKYIDHVLEYELLLQATQSSEGNTLLLSSDGKFVSIPRSRLKPDTTYCIKVRSIPKIYDMDDLKGKQSKWSPSTCWKNEADKVFSEQENIVVILTKYLVPVGVVVGVVLFVFYCPAARMKIKTLSHTPSPAPFFQPLFQQHEGNLQEWLSSQGKYVLTYKTEEILTSDAVIVVPKPITKDSAENQNLHKASVTQLTFTQCQTSYVGLPGMHEVSPPLTMVCPGNSSYTQLPCSVWGANIGGVEVVSPPPEDIFNISQADSGCEDVTQSPECSLPNSPVDDTPPPCYCNDYCILNKTAEGFSPVLVSREAA